MLASFTCSATFYNPRPPAQGMALPIVGWAFLHELVIKKCPMHMPQVSSSQVCQGNWSWQPRNPVLEFIPNLESWAPRELMVSSPIQKPGGDAVLWCKSQSWKSRRHNVCGKRRWTSPAQEGWNVFVTFCCVWALCALGDSVYIVDSRRLLVQFLPSRPPRTPAVWSSLALSSRHQLNR